jgi:L-alanine-DL-glutamate epimerase-like enolase superfamily enzyme
MSSMTGTALGGPAYELLAGLALSVDSISLAELAQPVTPEFTRRTTVIQLGGDGATGVGEDATPTIPGGSTLARAGAPATLAGEWTLESFSAHLDALDLTPAPPWLPASFRRWGLESAALDLALRQAGRSLASVLGVEPRPVRFVNSLRLPVPPSIDPLMQRLETAPGLRFKLDPLADWDDALLERIAATGAVDVVDFKGQYPPFVPIAALPDAALYERVAEALPDAWLEDPAVTDATVSVLARFADRITWDVPIVSVDDLGRTALAPRAINIKPARIGTVRGLLDVYDACARAGIATYGGGMFELGPGRGQIQYLASLFHPDAPNDVAPVAYNRKPLNPEAPESPLKLSIPSTGFR